MDFLFTAHFKRVIALLLAVLPSLGMAQSISDGLSTPFQNLNLP